MSWPKRDEISDGVVQMLRVNMGLQRGEQLLVVTDLPRDEDWQSKGPAELEDMLERAMLARLVADVARERFPGSAASFLTFPATGGHGTEPDENTARRLREPNVVIALTTYSLSHTNAREEATLAGVRLASMPSFQAEMLSPDGPMAVDQQQVAADCRRFADLLTAAEEAVVRTPAGTELHFSLAGRQGQPDDGLYQAPGTWGNLPAGEAYIAPLEGTAEGQLVVQAGWAAGLMEDMVLRFEKGLVVDVRGGGQVGDGLRRLLDLTRDEPAYRARRNLAELGIGCNPKARRPDNVLEAEKIKGTVHLAIGDNAHMGGQVESDLHDDFVQPEPDLLLDGQPVILRGQWQA
jgi:leucyl aminopeptidase (aminopeptidase T)